VLFLEHKMLYFTRGDVPEAEEEYTVPIGKADVKREGKDLTLATFSYSLLQALEAAEELKASRGSTLRWWTCAASSRWTWRRCYGSVAKTGRLLAVHESQSNCGIGAEIVARAYEEAPYLLKAPARRLGMAPVSIPVSKPLEEEDSALEERTSRPQCWRCSDRRREMATEIKIPDLGEGIADVTVSRWRAHKGDAVKAGDVIVEVATDKVDTEIAAPADGVLLAIHHNEGEIVSLDAVLGVIGAAGEDASAAPQAAGKAAGDKAPAPASAPSAASSAPAAAAEDEIVKASPVARRVAADKGVDLATVAGTGPGGQITKGDVLARAEQGGSGSPVALPGDLANEPSLVVRRAAADLNVNLGEVAQGRPLSMLTKYDVLSAAASRAAGKEVTVTPAFPPPSAPAAAPAAAPVAPAATPAPRPAAAPAAPAVSPSPAPQLRGGEELVKHSRMRAAVARNTSSSLFSAPHVTTMWDVDMTAVLAHRAPQKGICRGRGQPDHHRLLSSMRLPVCARCRRPTPPGATKA
jgi:pyruvate/2-oxoglutarate dehydrogenase complex dihydrolipoamide acyltransferase (E2) component